jgi:hypothetical protein
MSATDYFTRLVLGFMAVAAVVIFIVNRTAESLTPTL